MGFEFQSTLLRKERLLCQQEDNCIFCVSIHAPTKGATGLNSIGCSSNNVSIHAPTKGATDKTAVVTRHITFQSTLLRKERQLNQNTTDITNLFQSTLLRKERPSLSIFPLLPYMFQSTLLRKERPFLNSQEGHSIGVSIHAPTKGATCSMCGFGIHMEVSIHAPTKGATAILHKSSSDFVLFLSNYTSSCFTLQAG